MFKTLVLTAVVGIAAGLALPANAAKWEPYKFKANEKYEFKITYNEDTGPVVAYYALAIRPTGRKSASGEDLFEVEYTSRGDVPASEMGAQTAYGLWSYYGVSLSMVFLNPAYAFFFTQLDLEVGQNMNFYGAGTVKITGKQSVGGREGFICKLFTPEEGKDTLVTEWTIDPALALPIKSVLYDGGRVKSEIDLVKYEGK